MRYTLLLLTLFFIFSCEEKSTQPVLLSGDYRAELKVSETDILPFTFKVKDANNLTVFNAEEEIEVDEIEYRNDSVFIKMPVFEALLAAKIEDERLKGNFIVEGKNRVVPFTAKKSKSRFNVNTKAEANIAGNWETVFSPNTEADSYIAKGVFKQEGNIVTGTFLTETGDYRFLEGIITGNDLKLSTFDGAHAFLFTGKVTDSTINGTFFSGNHWKEPFTAKRNENYNLPNANNLTYLNEGYDSLAFTFPDANGNMVSLNDERFKNKVVLVQIMGTWCPNCLDESKYYTEFYKQNKDKGLEIVALAFEYAKTEAKAFAGIKRLQERISITYPILLAQTGSTSKQEAQKKLPMLNHVLSYPTTVFVDKQGKVRKIHTGFNGPATGEKFVEFKTEFNEFVNKLLEE
ncbi:peroxiredoxin [Lacinutrix sp. 5H-3-7-4]|uniref:peroxiredoxin family protein n=1 Tax=Lacinutrix sp. (strain 5H-3-7-4) TaxID=983544 RepID=UPI00020A3B29|nr:TlpA disulfide reductase family protein [Lacinutrix sp. 5H-3-7-4]AEH02754.1 alkyl hydroperoxide reductase/ Thiol specific antioxidant/ Mal allergen [Lacinutrix sp. 5H-3-7-4]